MANRRACQMKMRRTAHTAMRRQGVIDQSWMSNKEGSDDSPRAQTAQKAQRARRA